MFQETHTTNYRHSSPKMNNERKIHTKRLENVVAVCSCSINSFLHHSCIDPEIYLPLSRHSTTIFRNLAAEVGRPVFAELGGEGVTLLWLADVGGDGENCPLGRPLTSVLLLESVRFGTMPWWWRSCEVEGGLGTGWASVPVDIRRLWSEGFSSKEACFFDSESLRLGCLWRRTKKVNIKDRLQ